MSKTPEYHKILRVEQNSRGYWSVIVPKKGGGEWSYSLGRDVKPEDLYPYVGQEAWLHFHELQGKNGAFYVVESVQPPSSGGAPENHSPPPTAGQSAPQVPPAAIVTGKRSHASCPT